MDYREMRLEEIKDIWAIDRTEYVDSIYKYEDGTLKVIPVKETFYGWPSGSEKIYGPVLKNCHDNGGYFLGGYTHGILKAVAVVDTRLMKREPKTLQLKFLHVDRAYRKQGIGGIMFMKAAGKARGLGAERMYISSCENKNTVDFYTHLGCRLSEDPDPVLYSFEPDDIHMEYEL